MNEDNENLMLGRCQALNESDIKRLYDDYKVNYNAEQTLHEICTLLFRKAHIRTLGELEDADDEGANKKAMDIKSDFYQFQSECVTMDKIKNIKVKHKKGDVRRDDEGNPITDGTNRDGSPRFCLYAKDEIEYKEETVEIPFYDYKNNANALEKLRVFIKAQQVLPDLEQIQQKLLTPDFNRGLELIREITKYYVFDDPEKFVERFALLICNAKSKGLNKHPKWPVLFSLVGGYGLGKGWFRDMIKSTYDEVFEAHSQPCSYSALLDTQFNALMMTRGFLCLDEKNGIDSKKCEQLKTLITEPTIIVNRKHVDMKGVKNLVTFLSCSNETIKDVMGLQKDRRIIEFRVLEKRGEMPEERLREIMMELWRVMPCDCPVQDKVIQEVLAESTTILDTKMYEIVSDLFSNHKSEFCKGNYVNCHALRESVKNMGGVRFMAVLDWCLENDVVRRQSNGSYTLLKRGLDKVMSEQKKNEELGNAETSTPTVESIEREIFGGLD